MRHDRDSSTHRALSDTLRQPNLARHQQRCNVCRHPDREAIEELFLRWFNPVDIASWYDIHDRSSIYRHAHATGLFARRNRNFRGVLERGFERVNEAAFTFGHIVRGIRAYASLTEDGQWIEPPSRQIIYCAALPCSPAAPLPSIPSPPLPPETPLLAPSQDKLLPNSSLPAAQHKANPPGTVAAPAPLPAGGTTAQPAAPSFPKHRRKNKTTQRSVPAPRRSKPRAANVRHALPKARILPTSRGKAPSAHHTRADAPSKEEMHNAVRAARLALADWLSRRGPQLHRRRLVRDQTLIATETHSPGRPSD